MKKRTNTAFWVEKEKRWCIAVQKNGTRKRFYSSTPGRTGQREANAKADAWLDDSIRDGKKKVAALYAQWVEELKLTCGTSYVTQCQRYGDCYILPAVEPKDAYDDSGGGNGLCQVVQKEQVHDTAS